MVLINYTLLSGTDDLAEMTIQFTFEALKSHKTQKVFVLPTHIYIVMYMSLHVQGTIDIRLARCLCPSVLLPQRNMAQGGQSAVISFKSPFL